MRKVNHSFFRYFAYALEILIFYVLQGTPNLIPEFFGSKPLVLIPIAVSAAAWENKIPALVIGAVCGLLTDIGSGGSVGFFAITLTLLCYAEAHIFENYLVPSFLTVTIVCFAAALLEIGIYFLLFRLPSGGDWGYLFVHHYISRIVYTFVLIIPFYFLNKLLYLSFSSQKR